MLPLLSHYQSEYVLSQDTCLGVVHIMWMGVILSCFKCAKHCSTTVSPTSAAVELGFISTFGGKIVSSKPVHSTNTIIFQKLQNQLK